MKNIKKIIVFFTVIFLFSGCNTIRKGFEPDKRSGEEFLVEKKSPLVMPPDFNKLPIPKEIEVQKDINENEFKSLITQDNQEIKSDEQDINKSFEELLLDKIKKN